MTKLKINDEITKTKNTKKMSKQTIDHLSHKKYKQSIK